MPATSSGTTCEALLAWDGENARDLPWRPTRFYAILVSEVMLQQTQVTRVVPRYLEWLERWPTVEALAAATPATSSRRGAGSGTTAAQSTCTGAPRRSPSAAAFRATRASWRSCPASVMARPLHVLIAGGGLAGLCLAQGLTRAGVSCAVYERDPEVRRQGYRITINGDGGNALEACLPPDLYELYLQSSRNTPPRRMSVVVDSQANELSTAPHFGAPNDGERPHTAIHRRTLRQILGARLGDAIKPAVRVVGFERRRRERAAPARGRQQRRG